MAEMAAPRSPLDAFIQMDESVFMDKVRDYPVLYSTGSKDYIISGIRERAWVEIAKMCGLLERDVLTVMHRYKTISGPGYRNI